MQSHWWGRHHAPFCGERCPGDSSEQVKAHVAKAREFLTAAELNLDLDLSNAATSNAVTSGINSKDAICLALSGRTTKSDNHASAIAELKRAGSVGTSVTPTLERLLRLKSKAQYQTSSVNADDAARAIDWAAKMLEAARKVAQALGPDLSPPRKANLPQSNGLGARTPRSRH